MVEVEEKEEKNEEGRWIDKQPYPGRLHLLTWVGKMAGNIGPGSGATVV